MMPGTVRDLLHSWAGRRKKRRQRAWEVTLLALMSVVWKERNRRAFEGNEHDFVHLRNSLLTLIAFWCTHEIPIYIDD